MLGDWKKLTGGRSTPRVVLLTPDADLKVPANWLDEVLTTSVS